MNKGAFVAAIRDKMDITWDQAHDVVNAFTEVVTEALQEDDGEVNLTGWGKFSVRTLPAHTGRNPSTGAAIQVAEKRAVRFKVGKQLSRSVND